MQQFLANHNISVIPQLPYSPDLAPCNFILFLKVKIVLKDHRFQDVDETKQCDGALYGEFLKVTERCFQKWQEH